MAGVSFPRCRSKSARGPGPGCRWSGAPGPRTRNPRRGSGCGCGPGGPGRWWRPGVQWCCWSRSSPGGEKRQGRVDAAADDVAAHALQNRVALAVPPQFAGLVPGAQAVFQLHKFCREAHGLAVGKILRLAQADTHGLAARPLLEEPGGRRHQFLDIRGRV